MMFRVLIIAASLGLASTPAAAQTAPAADRSAPELYKQACLACHMADGNSPLEQMNFADGKWKHGTSVKEMAKVISEGVPGTAMMPFKTRFSEAEILELAKYVRSFDKALKADAAGGAAKKKAVKK
jgi:mono/diheme cytochrome c family protein